MKKDIGVLTPTQEQWDIIKNKYDILHRSRWDDNKEKSVIFFELKSYSSKRYAEASPIRYELISFQEWEERFNYKPKVGDWVIAKEECKNRMGVCFYKAFQVNKLTSEFLYMKSGENHYTKNFRKALLHEIPTSDEPNVGEYYFYGKELYVINEVVNDKQIRISGVGGASASVKNQSYSLELFYGGLNADDKWRKALPHEIPSNTKPLSVQGGESMNHASSIFVTMTIQKRDKIEIPLIKKPMINTNKTILVNTGINKIKIPLIKK